jgi:hypothetical protein
VRAPSEPLESSPRARRTVRTSPAGDRGLTQRARRGASPASDGRRAWVGTASRRVRRRPGGLNTRGSSLFGVGRIRIGPGEDDRPGRNRRGEARLARAPRNRRLLAPTVVPRRTDCGRPTTFAVEARATRVGTSAGETSLAPTVRSRIRRPGRRAASPTPDSEEPHSFGPHALDRGRAGPEEGRESPPVRDPRRGRPELRTGQGDDALRRPLSTQAPRHGRPASRKGRASRRPRRRRSPSRGPGVTYITDVETQSRFSWSLRSGFGKVCNCT